MDMFSTLISGHLRFQKGIQNNNNEVELFLPQKIDSARQHCHDYSYRLQ